MSAQEGSSRISDSLIQELEQEGATTRRVLERVPEDKLAWQPHEKSMTLGKLAHHVASIPANVSDMAAVDTFDFGGYTPPNESTTTAEILAEHDSSVQKAKDFLSGMDDARARATWKATMGGKEMMAMPRASVLRNILLNHWIHHRGQLSVYLRLLNVPVPSIYGPSADESPFG